MAHINCKICKAISQPLETATVLKRHSVEYYRCSQCGFIQTENPYWLEEAYSSAITNSDVGLIQRNLTLARATAVIINCFFDKKGNFIDYGGGYGLFVRLMRDRGFNFFWHDPYCENLFAKHFEANLATGHRYGLLTAFEVLEHLVDPWSELASMQNMAESVLFTTRLVPNPVPPLNSWWYYGLEHGQHVSLYTVEALRRLGTELGMNLYTDGVSLHLLTPRRLNPLAFHFAASWRHVGRLWNMVTGKSSLAEADYQLISGQSLGR
jgi:hypothetical protein